MANVNTNTITVRLKRTDIAELGSMAKAVDLRPATFIRRELEKLVKKNQAKD